MSPDYMSEKERDKLRVAAAHLKERMGQRSGPLTYDDEGADRDPVSARLSRARRAKGSGAGRPVRKGQKGRKGKKGKKGGTENWVVRATIKTILYGFIGIAAVAAIILLRDIATDYGIVWIGDY